MKPSVALELKRVAVREAASRFRAANPRIFGSVLHGTDQDGSVANMGYIHCWICSRNDVPASVVPDRVEAYFVHLSLPHNQLDHHQFDSD